MTEMLIVWLPRLNAALNGTAALFLLAGFTAIRRRQIDRHRRCMITALAISALFLASYVTYHTIRQMHTGIGHTRYTGTGWLRPVYFSILISHLVLAIVNLPMILTTLIRALRGQFDAHRRIARWTWPMWMYVSVTGVLVYLMLYHT